MPNRSSHLDFVCVVYTALVSRKLCGFGMGKMKKKTSYIHLISISHQWPFESSTNDEQEKKWAQS